MQHFNIFVEPQFSSQSAMKHTPVHIKADNAFYRPQGSLNYELLSLK